MKIKKHLKVIVVEDDPISSNGLIRDLNSILPSGSDISGPFENYDQAIYAIATSTSDLAILDIELGSDQLAGVKIGKVLQQREIPFVYLTGLPDKVAYEKALETYPTDFLKKPYDRESLMRVIFRIVKSKSTINATTFYDSYREDRIRLTTGRSKYEIYWIKDLTWVEVDDKFIKVGLAGGQITDLITFSLSGFYSEWLSIYQEFFLLSRKHIINLNYVERVEGNQTMIGQKIFKIPPPKKEELLTRLGGWK